METLPPDPTLDEIRAALAPALAQNAAFDGWNTDAIAVAAVAQCVDPDVARLAVPDGATDMIAPWFEAIDRAMLTAIPDDRLATM